MLVWRIRPIQCCSDLHGIPVRYGLCCCSVAVQTPIGLMVPVVRDADIKGLAQIAAEVKQLAAKVGATSLVLGSRWVACGEICGRCAGTWQRCVRA